MQFKSYSLPKAPAPVSLLWDDNGLNRREARDPGSDLSDLPRGARAEIAAVWTPGYVAAWQAKIAANKADDAARDVAHRPYAIRAEAERRKADVMTEEARLAATERLLAAVLTHGPDPAAWPAGEQAVATRVLADRARIAALDAARAQLLAMDPIPADFRDDGYWK